MAATNKCLAKSNKSRTGGGATKKRTMDRDRWGSAPQRAQLRLTESPAKRAHWLRRYRLADDELHELEWQARELRAMYDNEGEVR
jgi:hypothetical protein